MKHLILDSGILHKSSIGKKLLYKNDCVYLVYAIIIDLSHSSCFSCRISNKGLINLTGLTPEDLKEYIDYLTLTNHITTEHISDDVYKYTLNKKILNQIKEETFPELLNKYDAKNIKRRRCLI